MIYLFIAVVVMCVLIAAACVVITVRSTRRMEYWKDSMRAFFQNCVSASETTIQAYVDQKYDLTNEAVCDIREEVNETAENLRKRMGGVEDLTAKLETWAGEIRSQVDDLKLDYKEAKAAASHINDYAVGLDKIFNYDPVVALKKSRKETGEF